MAKTSITASPPRSIGAGRISTWLLGLVCLGLLAFLLLQLVIQLLTPPPVSRLQLLRDVPLTGILVSQSGQTLRQSVHFDRFDFQALDPQTGLLFTSHDGPSASKFPLITGELPAGSVLNPSIVVFDTRQNKYVASINNVNVRGIIVAPDIHKVYAADAGSSVIRVIDEQACQVFINAGQFVCTIAHGLAIDESQHVAFVACVDSRNLAIVDLQTMKPIGDLNNLLGIKADIIVLDRSLHVLFVGCQNAISVFDESRAASGVLHKFGDYIVSSNSSHSIAVDDSTHNIYIPLPDVGSL